MRARLQGGFPPALTFLALALAAPAVFTAETAVQTATQEADTLAPPSRLRGALLVGGTRADSGTVVLHRVTPVESGPVDSVRVGPEGGFSMEFPAVPSPGSGVVYFASAHRDEVLYFGPPITSPEELAEEYRIEAYETRAPPSGGIELPVATRNLFIDPGPMGWRVTDVFEVRSDSTVTWLSEGGGPPVWRYPLPPGVQSFRAVQADRGEVGMSYSEGTLTVRGPVPPGHRLFVVEYELESIEFTLPLPGVTDTLEVLVASPAPRLAVEGLAPAGRVDIEPGRAYERWRATDLSNRVVRVREGAEPQGGFFPWVVVGLALLLFGVGTWFIKRSAGDTSDDRAAILLEVARLDESFGTVGDPAALEEYRRRRRSLLMKLRRDDPSTGAES
ncbi:MAG: hypothetical protein WD960_02330 [Gemmatimonadota bacterium]